MPRPCIVDCILTPCQHCLTPRAPADTSQPNDSSTLFLEPVLVDITEPRAIAAEVLVRSSRSATVSRFCKLLVAKTSAPTLERTFAWMEHYLVNDASCMHQGTLSEPAAPCRTTMAACYERAPHHSWSEQAPASAGRAYTALCLAQLARQRARARIWLVQGKNADGQDFTQAVLRQAMGAAEQARLMLQCCVEHVDDVDSIATFLRESGHGDLIPHLVDAAAEELAQLRDCRARMEASGWVRRFLRCDLATLEEMLSAFAAIA